MSHLSKLLLLAIPLCVAACQDIDPYRREYMWQPEGIANGNLAAQVVEPMDLVRGRGSDTTDGGWAAAAVIKRDSAGPGGGPALSGGDFSPGGGGSSSGGGGGGSSSGGGQ